MILSRLRYVKHEKNNSMMMEMYLLVTSEQYHKR